MPTRRLSLLSALALGALLLLVGGSAPAFAQPAVLFVDADAAGAGDGSSWADAFAHLQPALAVAAPGDEVWVAEGTYRPTDGGPDAFDRTASFRLPDGVGLYGGFGGTETTREQREWKQYATVLSGDVGAVGDSLDNSYHVVVAAGVDTTAILDGFTVEHGYADQGAERVLGAGLFSAGGSLTLRNTRFRYNATRFRDVVDGGAGVYAEGVTLTVEDVVFERNVAQDRGGGLYAVGGELALTRVAFEADSALTGGGMYTLGSVATCSDCRFERNGTRGGGGGWFIEGGEVVMDEALFERNAYGALFVQDSSPLVRRAVFRSNTIDGGDGGAVRISGTSSFPRFEDSLFESNAASSGAAVFSERGASPAFVGCTFRDNRAESAGAVTIEGGDALVLDSRFEGNAARTGSALFLKAASGTVIGSVFTGNRTIFSGSGGTLRVFLAASSGTPVLIAGTLVAGNASTRGGGLLFSLTDEVHIVNSAIVGNAAEVEGGGLYLSETLGAPIHLTHVTVAANTAAESGAGLWVGGGWGMRIANSVFWGNRAPAAPPGREAVDIEWGTPPVAEAALIEGGCPVAVTCAGVVDADPLFERSPSPGPDGAWGTGDDDYGDLRVREGSPAVDAGLASLLPADRWDLDGDGDTAEPLPVDIAGEARVRGGAPDLGAYESAFAVEAEDGAEVPETAVVLGEPYPNPSSGAVSVPITLKHASKVRLAVFDVLGREVASFHDGVLEAGDHALRVDTSALRSGVYVVRLVAAEYSATRRFTIVR